MNIGRSFRIKIGCQAVLGNIRRPMVTLKYATSLTLIGNVTLDIGPIPSLNLESANHVVADQGYCDIVLSRIRRISLPVVGPLSCHIALSFRSVVVLQHKSADHEYPRI